MNATCPRCGTVALIGAQARRVICKTCGLSYCRECQHWKIDRPQDYCASCGAMFTIPPPMMPSRLRLWMLHVPYLASVLLLPMMRLPFWHVALAAILLPLMYTLAYIVAFSRRTGLVRAAWREAALLARRVLTLAAMVYIVLMGGRSISLAVGLIVTVVLVTFALAIRRNDARIIQELQANHYIWKAVLSMSNRDAFLMRFPQPQAAK